MQRATWLFLAFSAIATCWTIKPCSAQSPPKNTISGRVLTASGEPVRRATVVLEAVKYADGSSESVGQANTGDNGEFSFSNLAPARYRLEAEKSGYVAGRFPRTTALVRLTPDDLVDDVTLRLVPVCVVSGYVLDRDGDPLSKAVVRLLQYKYSPGGRHLTVARETLSDERGEYRIGDLDPGRYYVVASYRSRISDVVCPPVYYPDMASFDDAMPLRLGPGDEAPVRFVLLPGKPVRVRGTVDGGVGTVHVSLIPHGGVPYAQLLSVDTSKGSFEFKDVLPGDYTVLGTSESAEEMLQGRARITVEDHEPTPVSVELRRMGHRRLSVSVEGPVSTQDVVISLHPPIASDDDDIIVAESDLATDAEPISTRAGNPIDLPYPGPFIVSAEKLPRGDLFIEGAEFLEQPHGGPPGPSGTDLLVVRLNSQGASVEGVVLDSADKPLAGAVVVALPQHSPSSRIDQSHTTTTDQYGQFSLHGLANTLYGVYAWEEVPDGAYYDPDYLADYAGTVFGINIASGKHYQVTLHAASTNQE